MAEISIRLFQLAITLVATRCNTRCVQLVLLHSHSLTEAREVFKHCKCNRDMSAMQHQWL